MGDGATAQRLSGEGEAKVTNQSDTYILAAAIADIFFKSVALFAAVALLGWVLGWWP